VFYDGWRDLVRILVLGIAGYTAVLLLLRASGKRTLSKLNAFDFVVTVALGSTLATVLLSDSVSLIDGVTALPSSSHSNTRWPGRRYAARRSSAW